MTRLSIFDATVNLPWPGDAAVTVSVVQLATGSPSKGMERRLNGKPVSDINSRLRGKPERPDRRPLAVNVAAAFVGTYVLGMGFTLTPAEREALITANPRNAERIFPYLGGEEVNTSPTQEHDRYVISFGQMELSQAEEWPDLMAIVREKVKPERDTNNRDVRRIYWWRFGETTPALYAAIAPPLAMFGHVDSLQIPNLLISADRSSLLTRSIRLPPRLPLRLRHPPVPHPRILGSPALLDHGGQASLLRLRLLRNLPLPTLRSTECDPRTREDRPRAVRSAGGVHD